MRTSGDSSDAAVLQAMPLERLKTMTFQVRVLYGPSSQAASTQRAAAGLILQTDRGSNSSRSKPNRFVY
jgi:hypothetical protein